MISVHHGYKKYIAESKIIEIKRGKVHQFLGMNLYFAIRGEFHILQSENMEDIIKNYLVNYAKTNKLFTP